MNKQENEHSIHTILTSAPSPHSTHPSRSCKLLRTLTFLRKHVLNYYLLNKTLNISTSRITILFCLADDVNVDFRDVDNWKLFNFIITFAFWIRRDIDGWNYLEYSSIFPALTATASDCHHENERKLDVESWPTLFKSTLGLAAP